MLLVICTNGAAADGHQSPTSDTTSILCNDDTTGHDDFILVNNEPYDWRDPRNDNLWQGVNGSNNPCPEGYRLPTEAEWDAERQSWSSDDAAGAFASPLKLPAAVFRSEQSGSYNLLGSGFYWSATVDNTDSRCLYFFSSGTQIFNFERANGSSVRCIKH